MKFLLLALGVLLSFAPVAHAANEVTLEVTLSETAIRVGDQVTLRVAVTHDPQVRIEFPDLYDKMGQLELVRRQPLAPTRPAENLQLSVTEYTITGFLPGQYRLPDITVQYILPDGTRGTAIRDGELRLEVSRTVTDPEHQALLDIKPPASIPRPAASLIQPGATGALAVASVLLLALAALRLRRPGVLDAIGPLDPVTQVRQDLSETAALPLITRQDYVLYYTRISASIRTYLDAQLGFDAMASTTREIRRTMERKETDRWQARIVTGLLEECDSVKWASYLPDPARAARAISMAMEIVYLTSTPSPSPDNPVLAHGSTGSP